jgi:hypothetical protein
MSQQAFQEVTQNSPESTPTQMHQIEGREWSLWGFTIAVTLALTFGIVSFTFPWFRWNKDAQYCFDLREWVVAWQLSYCSSTSTLSTSTCNSTVFDVSWRSEISSFNSSAKMLLI